MEVEVEVEVDVAERELAFTATTDPGQVFAALSSRYAVHAGPAVAVRWTCLDTADWRLFRAGMTLRDTRHGRRTELVLSDDQSERTAASSPPHPWPRRVATLAPSEVRDAIAPVVGVRALLPLAEVGVRSIPLHLLDNEDKTRVRVRVDQPRLTGVNRALLPLRVLLLPVRGYENDAQRCADLLALALAPVQGRAGAATAAMTLAGHIPGEPAVLAPQLDPAAPAAESLARVLGRWLDVMDIVRPGVLEDIDIEYLHEMRTAVRATRSMLTLAGDLLPGREAARFAAEFAWLGRLTTPLRDLDVSLLGFEGRGAVDLSGLADLDPLRRYLAGRRRGALRDLRAGLRSTRSVGLGREWRRVLDQVVSRGAPGPTTTDVAAVQAREAYQRIAKAATRVAAQTPADDLHRLRRRCKRMRYLLDGFESVYAPTPLREVLNALKRLQDCLGDIQDTEVQHRQLAEIAATLTRRGASTSTVLAMGALRERGSWRDIAAREDLVRRLRRLSESDINALAERRQ